MKVVSNIIDIKRHMSCQQIIFRSSTNAEDLKNFNGAGLYESVVIECTGNRYHDFMLRLFFLLFKGSPEIALKDPHLTEKAASAMVKVWASLWSFKGFMERYYFGIPNVTNNIYTKFQC